MKSLKELGNEYYQVKVDVCQLNENSWKATGSISRKDTGEALKLGGYRAFGKTQDEALKILHSQFIAKVENLGAPYDWGNPDKVRILVNEYIQYSKELSKRSIFLQKQVEEGLIASDELQSFYYQLIAYVTKSVNNFVKKILDIDTSELVRLVECDEKAYISAESHIDEIYAKEELFYLISNPSEAVLSAHGRHHKRMFSPPQEES